MKFFLSSHTKATIQPYITRYTKAGSLYYTDDWSAYTFLPIQGNHVAASKDNGILKGKDHINDILKILVLCNHWLYQYSDINKAYLLLAKRSRVAI